MGAKMDIKNPSGGVTLNEDTFFLALCKRRKHRGDILFCKH